MDSFVSSELLSDVYSWLLFMGFCAGFIFFEAIDSLIDFIIKKKRQIAEKRKKGE